MSRGRLDNFARCAEHDCPMFLIEGEYVCILEYVDEHLGGKQVKDLVVVEGGLITILFDDNHELPLLCPHCGEPVSADEDEFLDEISDLYLVALQYVPADGEEEEYEGIEFLFAADPDIDIDDIPEEADVHTLLLHPDSAREIVCPIQ
ncbi:MAG TPA: hypothetical protein VJG32_17125 [Anaerolineae bacterium]|nr:hypothetical protein [Anaerolineae bacterium]